MRKRHVVSYEEVVIPSALNAIIKEYPARWFELLQQVKVVDIPRENCQSVFSRSFENQRVIQNTPAISGAVVLQP